MNPRIPALLAAAALALVAAPSARAALVVNCPFVGVGDSLDRGFYLDNYPGTSLGTVVLAHAATPQGERTISLTARLSSYDGVVIGIATATRTLGATMSKTEFDFGNVPVTPGSRIAFTQSLLGGVGGVSYDGGLVPCANVVATTDTTPPLSTFRRNSVGLMVTGDTASIASATTLACPTSPTGATDRIARGIYILNYQGVTIDTVTLRHWTDTPGSKTIMLIARLHRFDGPVIGTVSVTRDIGMTLTPTVFDFGGVSVPAGSTITFEQVLVAGTAEVEFDAGFGPCGDVIQTFGVTAPLDSERQSGTAITITGRIASDAPVLVVEYFHQVFGHYFMTARTDEIAALDGGAYGGVFMRTGQTFLVRDGPVAGTTGVCRFFTTAFAPKSSHFYTAEPAECAGVLTLPAWTFENIAFYTAQPVAGVCPAGLVPVYRLYNNGQSGAPNHRFTTSLATYNTFISSMGWFGEGIRFCAPV